MDAHGEVERAETGESVLDDEPQGLSALQSAREDKSVENLEEAQILAPHSDDVGRTISEKPTFMRIERKHISAETLTKYSIPHIDDPVRKSAGSTRPLLTGVARTRHSYLSRNGFQKPNWKSFGKRLQPRKKMVADLHPGH